MANEKRLMCVEDFKKNLCHYCNTYMSEEPCEPNECWVHDVIAQTDTVDAVELPCKMGDLVWGIHKINHHSYAVKQGVVNQMYFGEDMRLCICVKNVCRGEWGKKVFATKEEAEAATKEDN